MKQKMVVYQNMFDPGDKIVASNKLATSWYERDSQIIKTFVHLNTGEAAQHKKCRCHHPSFINGVCRYRNCNHDERHHH